MFKAGIWIPVIFSFIEMGLNKLQLRMRHAVIVFMTSLIYMLINWLGTALYGNRPVYPNVLVWEHSDTPGETFPIPGRDEWNSFGLFTTIFVVGNPVVFLLLALIHRYKFFCCKGDQQVGRARDYDIDTAAR